jgi:hypothetical protein
MDEEMRILSIHPCGTSRVLLHAVNYKGINTCVTFLEYWDYNYISPFIWDTIFCVYIV